MRGMTSADPLLTARALVLRDLASQGGLDPHTVSVVEDCVAQRRWWLAQWSAGEDFIAGLVAQDVQDMLFDEARRWPVCDTCAEPVEHSLAIEPELGPDPHWVCSESGSVIAPLGHLSDVTVVDPEIGL
ncbi:MAG: hypothetical protein QOJ60_2200 [Actinomycetota bacterium]|nr:hypothetical protein [Actinomycetota bacterium]